MAKSFKNLWSKITSWENLLAAYKRCRKRKRYKAPATKFDFFWETSLLQLQHELIDGTYKPGVYRHFHITDPKPRKISAAPFRDRVVHHALVGILEPLFDRRFIYDSYACRRGKGTHRAINRTQQYLRQYDWYLKTDVVRFFPNVDHQLLFTLVSRTIRDSRTLKLIELILESGDGVLANEATQHWFPGDDLLSVLRPRGLPIGNLTSQFFANVFLDPVDHYIKEELRVPGYVRYADDLILFGHTKQQLWQWRDDVAYFLEKQRLQLHAHKTHVCPSIQGVPFLGFRLSRLERRLKQEAIWRFNRRLKKLKWLRSRGEIEFHQIRASLRAWLAHTDQANAEGLRQDLWQKVKF
jgi:retron-type reverse transcriptase